MATAKRKKAAKKRTSSTAGRLAKAIALTAAAAADAAGKPIEVKVEKSPEPPTVRTHDLKSWPEHFAAVDVGLKNFEIRRNDRDFRVGERVVLREWIPHNNGEGTYTGREAHRSIVLITQPIGVESGFVALSLAIERLSLHRLEAPAT